jgi:hypothetical protein
MSKLHEIFNELYIKNMVQFSEFKLDYAIQILSLISNFKSKKINLHLDLDYMYDIIKNIIINYLDQGVNIDIEPNQIVGGLSDEIWPIFSEIYKKNSKLEFKQKNNPNLIFSVIKHKNDVSTPLLGKGTYTAVYEVQKIENGIKKENYILRFTTNTKPHFLEQNKIMTEYLNFGKYLPKRYYYGYCIFNDKTMRMKSHDNYISEDPKKRYNFEYFITKKYTPFDWTRNVSTSKYIGFNLSNIQKFDLLVNIVKLLNSFYEKNIIHTDLKIDNISFDENLVPICIDYDNETLQEVST